jgi:colicin import membrane protein
VQAPSRERKSALNGRDPKSIYPAIVVEGPCLDGMQAARFEGSLMTSLAELKNIEHQRVADERAAVVRAEEARVQARLDAERRTKEEAEAKARAEYEAQLAIERAKVEAEREARLRIEATEAAEAARQRMLLEQERSQQEMALRRAEVAKKRPTWMVALTAFALVAAAVLVVFTVRAFTESDKSDEARVIAENKAHQAEIDAENSRIELEKITQNLKDLDGKVTVALANLEKARDKASKDAAEKEIRRLRDQQIKDQQRQADLQRQRELQKRLDGVKKVCDSGAICKDTK